MRGPQGVFRYVSFRYVSFFTSKRNRDKVKAMSEEPGDIQQQPCTFPGCTRPSRPDAATGRPSLYCEEPDPSGGPVHNRVNAWRARRAEQGSSPVATDRSAQAPVSMARASLEQRLGEFPGKLGEFRDFLDAAIATIREAGDIEAAGAEVEDAHRDALATVAEAERRASTAERAARLAEERSGVADRERQEADAVAEESMAQAERVREELTSELVRVREQTDAAITASRAELADAQRQHATALASRDRAVERARADTDAAKLDTAAAVAARTAAEDALAREIENSTQLRAELDRSRRQAEHDREQLQAKLDTAEAARQQSYETLAATRLQLAAAEAARTAAEQAAQYSHDTAENVRGELEATKAEMRSEREALRSEHAAQVAQIQHSADQRAEALQEALQAVKDTRETRGQ